MRPACFGLIYMAENVKTGKCYIGQTWCGLESRKKQHMYSARRTNTKFHAALRKYPEKFWVWHILQDNVVKSRLDSLEKYYIKEIGMPNLYNLTTGGRGAERGPIAEATRDKLKAARVGRKPALGMKHTEATKKLCGQYGKLRWDIYGRYDVDKVLAVGYAEAHRLYKISKTHYYRLRKQKLQL